MNRWEELLWTGGGPLYKCFATPLSMVYGFAAQTRAKLFQKSLLTSYRPKALVISVGNLTPGGSGKTPLVLALADALTKRSLKAVILTRGYGGSGKDRATLVDPDADPSVVGDEPAMIAAILPSVPVIKAARRIHGARLAEAAFKPDIILLDDGFGHLSLARDFDIIVVDAFRGFGNCKTMPAGPLREPITELKRADCIIVTHSDAAASREIEDVKAIAAKFAPKAAVLEAAHRVDGIVRSVKDSSQPASRLTGRKVVTFSGIGNPIAFRRTVKNIGIEIAASFDYPDHHRYTDSDIDDIARAVTNNNSYCALTTEKDLVRLKKKRFPVELFAIRIIMEVKQLGWLIDRILEKS